MTLNSSDSEKNPVSESSTHLPPADSHTKEVVTNEWSWKRKVANRILIVWALLVFTVVYFITKGDMDEVQLAGLKWVFSGATTLVAVLTLGLYGLEAAVAAYIPGWRAK